MAEATKPARHKAKRTGTARRRPRPSATMPNDEQGPHHVELLFHGQRPRVEERRHRPGDIPVVAGGGDLVPVREEEQRGQGIGPVAGIGTRGSDEAHVGGDRQDHQEKTGQQPPRSSSPEAEKMQTAAGPVIGQQKSGDQIAGQDIEDVHAHEPTRQ